MQTRSKWSKKLFIVVLAAWLRWNSSTVAAAPIEFDNYCGDGICQDGGCDINGNETPGNGCRETSSNCPDDCPVDNECHPNWVETDTVVGTYSYYYYTPGVNHSQYRKTVVASMHDANECPDSEDYAYCYWYTAFELTSEFYIDACTSYYCGGTGSNCPL
jgi:hypothetical protein